MAVMRAVVAVMRAVVRVFAVFGGANRACTASHGATPGATYSCEDVDAATDDTTDVRLIGRFIPPIPPVPPTGTP